MIKNTDNKKLLNIIEAIVILFLLIFIILVAGKGRTKDISMSDAAEYFLGSSLTEGLGKKEDFSANQSFGLVPKEYVYIKSDEIMDVRELFIVKTSSDEEMEKIEDAVAERLEDQISSFTNYGTNQLSLLENALTFEKGRYYFYAVGEDADKLLDEFKKLIS